MPRPDLSTFNIQSWLRVGLLAVVLAAAGMAKGQSDTNRVTSSGADNSSSGNSASNTDSTDPRPLRQPGDAAAQRQDVGAKRSPRGVDSDSKRTDRTDTTERTWSQPSEFEIHVNKLAFPSTDFRRDDVLPIRRLGSELMVETRLDREVVDFSPLVPADYLISPGDEIVLSMWGSVDAELRLIVDRSGRITLPRIGTIMVSGVRYADLPEVIRLRVAQTFKNFQLSVSLGQLRGVRIFVTGFVARPGAYTVNALSGMANALVRAGGPSASGSFRDIQLRRSGKLVSKLDFYDLLLNGNRNADQTVQADDVIHVGPIAPQVGVIGSVNRAAIFELKPGETMADALRMAGGF
ncbi:MAG: polysaccharide biosynthesis/export family protein, partial [Aestuariivirga sp.]